MIAPRAIASMVCLSGGKDSSHAPRSAAEPCNGSAPVRFELIAVNLDQAAGAFLRTCCPNTLSGARACPSTSSSRTPTSVVKRVMPEAQDDVRLCSRHAARALYRYAREQGITKIALGHHRDDLIETLFLNMFFGGKLKSMPPKLRSEDGHHIVIRPLAYVASSEYRTLRACPRISDHPRSLCGSQHALQRVAIEENARGLGEGDIPDG